MKKLTLLGMLGIALVVSTPQVRAGGGCGGGDGGGKDKTENAEGTEGGGNAQNTEGAKKSCQG